MTTGGQQWQPAVFFFYLSHGPVFYVKRHTCEIRLEHYEQFHFVNIAAPGLNSFPTIMYGS